MFIVRDLLRRAGRPVIKLNQLGSSTGFFKMEQYGHILGPNILKNSFYSGILFLIQV